MMDTVRTVPTGNVGLDLALAGGFRFVRRSHDGQGESAIVLVRGGPGTGKSVLAQDIALRLARENESDVLYYCMEVLPSEVLAQRAGFEGFDPSSITDLSREGRRSAEGTGPAMALGMLEVPTSDDLPDVGSGLLALVRIATARGFSPKVVVIDCLSDGYGLGGLAPRSTVDGLCKLAVEQGWVLILVEECVDETPSPWTFAVDTVLWLRLAPMPSPSQWRRELVVAKHRFGGCEPGPHRLSIERERVRVIPPFAAYRNALRDLVLPEPAKGRTLALPSMTEEQRTHFAVKNGQGRCVVVQEDKGIDHMVGHRLTIAMGSTRKSRKLAAVASFLLLEKALGPLEVGPGELHRCTLDQFVDGQEWLELVFHDLTTFQRNHGTPVDHIRIGPTTEISTYADAVELNRAVSLLAGLLGDMGLIVILFGKGAIDIPRAAIRTDLWFVNKKRAGQLSVKAHLHISDEQVEFDVDLDALP